MKPTTNILLWAIVIAIFAGCNSDKRKEVKSPRYIHTYETDDTIFYNAEILPPDYVHLDSLLVINADSLNWAMQYYDAASDGDIMDILRAYCYPIRHGNIIIDNTK